jgi:hypothetical protein
MSFEKGKPTETRLAFFILHERDDWLFLISTAFCSLFLWHNKGGNTRLPLFLFKKMSFRANPLFF